LIPFFSIAVTTYNRRELLKEALMSIINQTFEDFEVIVGNDYVQEPVSPEMMGIDDPRINIVNHPRNLGEINNMNYLLSQSKGRYFTWLADDDLYSLDILETVYTALSDLDFPPCAFTSFQMGSTYQAMDIPTDRTYKLLTGKEFLRKYLSRSLETLGCCGIFDRQYIKYIGGIQQLGDSFSPYSDNLLAIRAGLLDKVIYIEAPLIFYRTHDESISLTSKNINAYISAQVDLVHKCLPIFTNEKLMGDYDLNVYLLIKWCMEDIVGVAYRSGSMGGKQMISHLLFLMRHMRKLKRSDLDLKLILQFSETLLKGAIGLLCARYSRSARSSQ
jgi:glycosyltransferase involved in cell wall biosynthesis